MILCPYPTCRQATEPHIIDGVGQCEYCKRVIYADEITPDDEVKSLAFINSKSMMQTPKEKGFIVEHMIQPNTVNQIFSPPACFKSILALSLAIHVANGRSWLGFKTKKCAVAYLDKENNRQLLRDRVNWLFNGMGLKRKTFPLFFLLREGMLDNDEFLEQLSDYIKANKIGLVVFDTLVRFNSGEENSAKDMNKLYQAFVKLQQDNKLAILFLHHTNRLGEFRGSSDLLGQVDTQFSVVRPQKSSKIQIINTKNRNGEINDISAEILFADDKIVIMKNESEQEVELKESVNKFQLARAFVCDYAKAICKTPMHTFKRAELILTLEAFNADRSKNLQVSKRLIDASISFLAKNKILIKDEAQGVFSLNMEGMDWIDKWICPLGEGNSQNRVELKSKNV